MALVNNRSDGTSTVYGVVERPGERFSRCDLPVHVMLVAQCNWNSEMCTYAYDGHCTIYNHSPRRKITCPANVTHLTALGDVCLMLTSNHELYYANKPQSDDDNEIAHQVWCDVELKAVGQSIRSCSVIGVSVDNVIYRIENDRGIIVTRTQFSCDDIGSVCNVSSTARDGNIYFVVWDYGSVYFLCEYGVRRRMMEDVTIKTCVQCSEGWPRILLHDGRLIESRRNTQICESLDIMSISSGSAGNGTITHMVLRD